MVLRGRGASLLPLIPLPRSPRVLIAALRPEVSDARQAQTIRERFRPLAQRIVAAGGFLS